MRALRSSSRPSYAAYMSAKRVSPPVGGTATACSTAAIDGIARQLTSLCQPFSYPPTSADLAKRTSSGNSPLAGMNGCTSRSPKRRAKATCCAAVIGWSRKHSTL